MGRGKEESSFFKCEIVCGREEMRVFVCSDHHKLTVLMYCCVHVVPLFPSHHFHALRSSSSLPSSLLPPLPSLSPLQVCIYFCGMFICVLAGQPWYSLQGAMLGTLALSGFFTYEVCCKLDPTLPLVSRRGGEGRGGKGKGGEGRGRVWRGRAVIVTFAAVDFIQQYTVFAINCTSSMLLKKVQFLH